MLLDLRARHFDQLAVFDARRARRLARAAVEAAVDVRDEPLAQLQPPLVHQLHLANAPARRIGFLAPQAIRRAMIQAKPAVNAARIVRVFGLVRAGEPADWAEWPPRLQIPPMNRPGLRMPLGSNTLFSFCISAKSPEGAPQTLISRFNSDGHHSRTLRPHGAFPERLKIRAHSCFSSRSDPSLRSGGSNARYVTPRPRIIASHGISML